MQDMRSTYLSISVAVSSSMMVLILQGFVEAGSAKNIAVTFALPKDVSCSLVAANVTVSCTTGGFHRVIDSTLPSILVDTKREHYSGLPTVAEGTDM